MDLEEHECFLIIEVGDRDERNTPEACQWNDRGDGNSDRSHFFDGAPPHKVTCSLRNGRIKSQAPGLVVDHERSRVNEDVRVVHLVSSTVVT
jgi:hypothetical protein